MQAGLHACASSAGHVSSAVAVGPAGAQAVTFLCFFFVQEEQAVLLITNSITCGSLFMLMMTPLRLHAAGVTSFSIDLESKKVTVMGHVSRAGVLESISKVKKVELLAGLNPSRWKCPRLLD